ADVQRLIQERSLQNLAPKVQELVAQRTVSAPNLVLAQPALQALASEAPLPPGAPPVQPGSGSGLPVVAQGSSMHSSGSAPLATREGMEINGYRFVKRIGSGGFGEVWRAEAPGGIPS